MSVVKKDDYLPHYSYGDYLEWEGEWELIDGIPYAMSPAPIKKHQILIGMIFNALFQHAGECPECEVLIDTDWKVRSDTVLKPDVALVCHDSNPKYISKTPEIIFEVISPSTAKKDEGLKYEIYEEEGVKYYVLVYPEDLVAKIFHLEEGKYKKVAECDTESFDFKEMECAAGVDFTVVFDKYRV
jgi:Uma2 family endonuclease